MPRTFVTLCTIRNIVNRYHLLYADVLPASAEYTMRDLERCDDVCPLDWTKLYALSNEDFIVEMCMILKCLNRQTGKLSEWGGYYPTCALNGLAELEALAVLPV